MDTIPTVHAKSTVSKELIFRLFIFLSQYYFKIFTMQPGYNNIMHRHYHSWVLIQCKPHSHRPSSLVLWLQICWARKLCSSEPGLYFWTPTCTLTIRWSLQSTATPPWKLVICQPSIYRWSLYSQFLQTWKMSFQTLKNQTTHAIMPDHCMQAV